MGAAVFVAVGENVLSQQLIQRLSWVPGFDASSVTSSGATSLLNNLPEALRDTALKEYNKALQKTLQVALYPSCLSILGTASFEWRSVKKTPSPEEKSEVSGTPEDQEAGRSTE